MSNGESMAGAMAEMLQSILATPKHQRRLKSGTFWDKLGFEKRTAERVKHVLEWFQERHVIINLRRRHSRLELANDTFGTEDKNDWIILSLVHPPLGEAALPLNQSPEEAVPPFPEKWFAAIVKRTFVSEEDVRCLFAFKLFEHLGYHEPDFSFQHTVKIHAGISENDKKADIVLFNGEDRARDHALIDVETKNPANEITRKDVGQAASYAMWLKTPYYVLTNGDKVQVFLVMAGCDDVLRMSFTRTELREKWAELFRLLGKKAVVELKEGRRNSV